MTQYATGDIVNWAIVEDEVSLLIDAPLIVRESYVHSLYPDKPDLSPGRFLDLLKQGLRQGLRPEQRLEDLYNTGQLALARKLQRRVGSVRAVGIPLKLEARREECQRQINHALRRLDSFSTMLNGKLDVRDLGALIQQAQVLEEDWWFDLALEQLKEVNGLLDTYLRDATKERQERLERAQTRIMEVRRKLLLHDHEVRQNGTYQTIRMLMSYAEEISMSYENDLAQVDEICAAIMRLYQGEAPDEELIERYRLMLESAVLPVSARAHADAVDAVDQQPMILDQESSVRVEHEALSPHMRATLESLIGKLPRLTLDLNAFKDTAAPLQNEEAARIAQHEASKLHLKHVRVDDAARADALLGHFFRLLQYWSGRKRWPDTVRVSMIENLFYYARVRGEVLLADKQWDLASEYFLSALNIRAQQQQHSAMDVVLLNYLLAYAAQTLPSDDERRAIQNVNLEQSVPVILKLAFDLGRNAEVAGRTLGISLVKLGAEHPVLLQVLQQALDRQSGAAGEALLAAVNNALEAVDQLLPSFTRADSSSQRLAALVTSYQRRQQQLANTMPRLIESTESTRKLRESEALFRNLQAGDYLWDQTNRDHIATLGGILQQVSQYLHVDRPFQERDRIAESLLQRELPILMTSLGERGTVFGRTYLNHLCANIASVIEEDIAQLQRSARPDLQVVVEQSQWRADANYYCHLGITNAGDMSADQIQIIVEESDIGEYQTISGDEHTIASLSPGQHLSLYVRVVPTQVEHGQNTFTLRLRVRYRISIRQQLQERRITLRIDDFTATRTQVQPIDNIYITGKPILPSEKAAALLFRGRDELIGLLLNEVAQPERTGSVVVSGQKRSGKTSLLHHLADRAPDFVVPVYFDIPLVLTELNRQSPRESIGRLLSSLIAQTTLEYRKRGVAIEQMNWETLMQEPGPTVQFRSFLEQLRTRAPNHRLLYLLDEFTTLIEKVNEDDIDKSIMRLFKSLIEHAYFSCVFCGSAELYEDVKPYANQLAVTQPRTLDYLSREAAQALIDEPIKQGSRSRFSSARVIEQIIDLTAGSPFYTQHFCYRLVEHMNRAGIGQVTAADIEVVTKEMTRGDALDLLQFENLYSYKDNEKDSRADLLEGCVVQLIASETETKRYAQRSVLTRLAPFISPDELDHTLGRLIRRRTIVTEAGEVTPTETLGRGAKRIAALAPRSTSYRIRVDLFRQWIQAKQPIDAEALLSFERRLRATPN